MFNSYVYIYVNEGASSAMQKSVNRDIQRVEESILKSDLTILLR